RLVKFFRSHEGDYPDIQLITSVESVFPSDQPDRLELLQEISDEMEPWWIKRMEDERLREALYELKDRAYELKPFRRDEVPSDVIQPFLPSNGSDKELVFVYDIGGETDGRKAMRFSAAVDKLMADAGVNPIMSGPEIILADIVQ